MGADIRGSTARQFLDLMGGRLGLDLHAAQCVLWQCIWSGALPINLVKPLRLNEPLELLTPDAFWPRNPIASRRTAWSH